MPPCLTSRLQLNCLLAIVDPCRESAGKAVRDCHLAGITVNMITGMQSRMPFTI